MKTELPSIFKKRTIISVDCSDLSDFIDNIYGIHVEIEATFELGHDDKIEIDANADETDEDEFNDTYSRIICSHCIST